jgi:uncharacterized protein (DUF302 family)
MNLLTSSLVIGVVILTAQACSNSSEEAPPQGQTQFVINDEYAVIRDNLEQAIIGRGLVITGVSHVGDMLTRTGVDLGNTRQVYVHAEVLEFCSAVLSRRMMEADPANIVYCPYGIAIYERADQPGKIYLAHRRLQGQGSGEVIETMKEIDALLDSIIQEALE